MREREREGEGERGRERRERGRERGREGEERGREGEYLIQWFIRLGICHSRKGDLALVVVVQRS